MAEISNGGSKTKEIGMGTLKWETFSRDFKRCRRIFGVFNSCIDLTKDRGIIGKKSRMLLTNCHF